MIVCVDPERRTFSLSVSPGSCAAMIARSRSAFGTFVPPTAVITSHAFSPADAAAVSGSTVATAAPFATVFTVTPSRACSALPVAIN